jgi:hypothetical protein
MATSSFTAEWMNVDGSDNDSREDIDTTYLGTTGGYRTYMPGDLLDGGEFTAVMHWTGAEDPPTDQAAEVITIDWAGSGKTWAFSGYMKNCTPAVPLGDKMTAVATFKIAGAITKTTA